MSLKVKNCHSSNISQLKNKATLLYHYYQGQISDKPNILTMGRDSNILFSVLLLGGIADFLFNGYFTRFLKIGGEWYISGWLQLLQLFGHSRVFLFIIATMASLGIPFWTINLFFMSLDLKGKPAFLRKYKIQSDKNIPVDWKLYKKCITVINKNQLIATILVILMYPATQWGGMKYEAEDLPSLPRFFSEMLYFAIVQEIAFYYLHRLMHYPALYKHIHKVHHEWTAPISMAVVYVHPIEHIVSVITL
ncbi:unnamed protein product [Clavelina lepadiformis]|uniref:Fatty acid hydroxylase domain-containing protein n=1 Tax=Clavelina lepadiformis TaxID=159417 RepID=A0ABP0H3G6_CLALP